MRTYVREWFANRMFRKMGEEERQGMMNMMMDKFLADMSPDERKQIMRTMMPRMMETMFEGISAEDRRELMMSMMPMMMSQMFSGETGMPSMVMRMMRGMSASEEGLPQMQDTEAREEFKPWECCPCRGFCRKGFEETGGTAEASVEPKEQEKGV